jgi:hypothetical protein
VERGVTAWWGTGQSLAPTCAPLILLPCCPGLPEGPACSPGAPVAHLDHRLSPPVGCIRLQTADPLDRPAAIGRSMPCWRATSSGASPWLTLLVVLLVRVALCAPSGRYLGFTARPVRSAVSRVTALQLPPLICPNAHTDGTHNNNNNA